MATEGGQAYVCVVCDEPVEAGMSADCNWCSRRYHLNQRNDVEAKDCGQVWIDEQYMALQFACDRCLQSGGDAPGGEGAGDSRIRTFRAPAVPGRTPSRRRYRRRD